MIEDSSIFSDVAAALGIDSPVLVEKDYFAIHLLQDICKLESNGYQFVFSGGTCLAKVHHDIYRMSEDIDIKMVANESTKESSRSRQKQLKKELHNSILDYIEKSKVFNLVNKNCKNEYKFQEYSVKYPKDFETINGIRPDVKLELTESELLEDAIISSVSSLYAKVSHAEPEISEISCVTAKTIACEKFISILRRTAAYERDNTKADDETLIRHIYDLDFLKDDVLANIELTKTLTSRVIKIDRDQFGNQHKEFKDDPRTELKFGLRCLTENPKYKERYQKFIGPLVYNDNPAKWDIALQALQKIADLIL